jgi:thiol-disulfide isomerase/thioredoxin
VNKTNYLLLTIILLCFQGCENKNDSHTLNEDKNDSHVKKNIVPIEHNHTFILKKDAIETYTFKTKVNNVHFVERKEPLLMVHFFATWCPPCQYEAPYLIDLQNKYKETLFIAGLIVNDPILDETLQALKEKKKLNYFIANNQKNIKIAHNLIEELQLEKNFQLPLTILYKNGRYLTHYEGAVPIEMIEHDIKQAIK